MVRRVTGLMIAAVIFALGTNINAGGPATDASPTTQSDESTSSSTTQRLNASSQPTATSAEAGTRRATFPGTGPATAATASTLPATYPTTRLAATRPAAPIATVRHSVPTPAQLEVANRQMFAAYPSLNAKTREKQYESAMNLMRASTTLIDSPVDQYAVLLHARNLFQAAGDAPDALAAVKVIDENFHVDRIQMFCDAAIAASKAASSSGSGADRECAVPALEEAADTAAAGGRFDLTGKLDSIAMSLASATNNVELRQEVSAHLRDRAEARGCWGEANDSRLKSTSAGQLAEGKFQCFIAGNWATGLPLLAHGSDPALASIARAELASQEMEAADDWWDYANSAALLSRQHAIAHRQLLIHSAALYGGLQPTATGLVLSKISHRMSEAAAEACVGTVHRRIDLLRLVDLGSHALSGNWKRSLNDGITGGGGSDLLRLAIPFSPPVAYDLEVSFARLSGEDSLDIYCIEKGRQFAYIVGGAPNSVCGIDQIKGQDAAVNGTAVHGPPLLVGKKMMASLHIRPESIEPSLEGHSLGLIKVDFSDVNLQSNHVLPRPDWLGLAIWQSSFVINSEILVVIDDRHSVLQVSNVKIISARWGGGSNWADVTERVSQLYAASIPMWANTSTLESDPTPHWRKHLRVDYSISGRQNSIEVNENELLKLPEN